MGQWPGTLIKRDNRTPGSAFYFFRLSNKSFAYLIPITAQTVIAVVHGFV